MRPGYSVTPLLSKAIFFVLVPLLLIGQASAGVFYPNYPYHGNGSIHFNSTTNISLGNVLQYERTQNWTVMAGIQINTKQPTAGIIFSNVHVYPYAGYELWIDDIGKLRVRIMNNLYNNNWIDVQGTTIVTDGLWHLVSASYNGSSKASGVLLYVDGIQETNTIIVDNLSSSIIDGSQIFLIGSQTDFPNYYLPGNMDLFMMSNITRNSSYIALYSNKTSIPPKDNNHTIYYDFEEMAGTTAIDASDGHLNGTLSNAGMWGLSIISSIWTVSTSLVNVSDNVCTDLLELSPNPSNGLMSYWTGDGCLYNWNRTTANDGLLTNGMIYSPGKYNQAFNFTGSNFITLSKGVSGVKYASLWINKSATKTDYNTFISHTNFRLYTSLTTCYLAFADGVNTTMSYNTDICDSTWKFIELIANGSSSSLVVDGTSVTGTISPVLNDTMWFGAWTGTIYKLYGYMDDIYFYDRVPTTVERALIKNQSKHSSGYIKSWYNSTPNQTYQTDVNGSNATNSNVSLQIIANGSSPSGYESPENTSLNASWAVTGFTNTDAYVWLFGNGTSTPQVSGITFFDQALSGGTYNVSGYINDSLSNPLESVSVTNNSGNTATNATGYYELVGLSDGNYNFTYSKAGYVTGYKEITINGADVSNQNVTLQSEATEAQFTKVIFNWWD